MKNIYISKNARVICPKGVADPANCPALRFLKAHNVETNVTVGADGLTFFALMVTDKQIKQLMVICEICCAADKKAQQKEQVQADEGLLRKAQKKLAKERQIILRDDKTRCK